MVISHIALPQLLFCTQTGLRSSCYMWLKCTRCQETLAHCATEDSSEAGKGLFPFVPSETSSSREVKCLINILITEVSYIRFEFAFSVMKV